jgi:predicted Zn-dependent peptidase
MEDLDAASLEDVKTFFRTHYAPNNAVLSIVGDAEPDEAFEAAERWFGAIPPNESIPAFEPPELAPVLGREHRETVPDAVPLSRIHFGFRTPPFGTPEFDALEIAAQILAGGRGSRLYRRLVREEQIAQDVVAFNLPLVAGGSIFAGWATVRPESDEPTVERAYLEELERIAHEPVTDDELTRAKALIEAAELGALGRVEEVADRLSMYAVLFDRPELVNEQLQRYLAVDADGIQRACAAIFRDDNRAIITYVPRAEEAEVAA